MKSRRRKVQVWSVFESSTRTARQQVFSRGLSLETPCSFLGLWDWRRRIGYRKRQWRQSLSCRRCLWFSGGSDLSSATGLRPACQEGRLAVVGWTTTLAEGIEVSGEGLVPVELGRCDSKLRVLQDRSQRGRGRVGLMLWLICPCLADESVKVRELGGGGGRKAGQGNSSWLRLTPKKFNSAGSFAPNFK